MCVLLCLVAKQPKQIVFDGVIGCFCECALLFALCSTCSFGILVWQWGGWGGVGGRGEAKVPGLRPHQWEINLIASGCGLAHWITERTTSGPRWNCPDGER